jgi:hypothetical protein
MPNITERQTRIKQANRSQRKGSEIAGYGALGYGTNYILRGGRTEADVGRTYRAHRLLMGGKPAGEQVRAAGSAARGLVGRNKFASLSAGAIGVGSGMVASGSVKRRYNEAKISEQRKANEKKAVSKALDVSPAFAGDYAIAKAEKKPIGRKQAVEGAAGGALAGGSGLAAVIGAKAQADARGAKRIVRRSKDTVKWLDTVSENGRNTTPYWEQAKFAHKLKGERAGHALTAAKQMRGRAALATAGTGVGAGLLIHDANRRGKKG